jgi:hypothetical protein
MNPALQIGPLSLPYSVLLTLVDTRIGQLSQATLNQRLAELRSD